MPAKANDERWSRLEADLLSAWPLERWCDLGVVVGCSGGADSVALLRCLRQARSRVAKPRGFLVAAHYNHGLRGVESDRDQDFVHSLAVDWNIEFASERCESTNRVGDEAGLRRSRLDFLIRTAHRCGARYVALAHSADDNVETILHHLMRGTGPSGLAGIRPHRPLGSDLVLVRPLLRCSRADIRAALEAVDQPWREDASNEDRKYRRNWIRHELLPQIEAEFPLAAQAIARAGEAQRQWCDWIEAMADDWLASHCTGTDPPTLRCDPDAPRPLIVAACQRLWDQRSWPRGSMSHHDWSRLAAAIGGEQPTSLTLPAGISIRRCGELLVLNR